MLEAELVSVAIDEISRVVSRRKPFTERGLPTWLRALAELTSVPWVEHRMRKPVGTCLQVGISRTRNLPIRRPIEQGSRSQSAGRVQALNHNQVPRLFHIYVVPCRRGKRILGVGLPV
jgi:hypothetical protein